MTTTPLTGYYSTGYYNNSISPTFIGFSAVSGIRINKAIDDRKLYAYYRHNGLPVLSGTQLFIGEFPNPGAPPIIGEGGVVTGSLNSITTISYALVGNPAVEIPATYSFTGLSGQGLFWVDGLSGSSGMWDDGGLGVRKYVDGRYAYGLYDEIFYNAGQPGSTLKASDGRAYLSGSPFSGVVPAVGPGGATANPLGWPNFDTYTVSGGRPTLLFTNGLSSLPPVVSQQRFENGRLYFSNKPFRGTAILNSDGLVLKYNNAAARSTTPVTIPLTAINERFPSALRRNTAAVSFDQGYLITGEINNVYYSKGMSTINVGLTSHTVYFNNGTIANGVIGNQVFSYGTKVSG